MRNVPLVTYGLSALPATCASKKSGCFEDIVLLNINAKSLPLLLPPIKNQLQPSNYLFQSVRRDAAPPSQALSAPVDLNKSYSISIQYCPRKKKSYGPKVTQVLTHSLGLTSGQRNTTNLGAFLVARATFDIFLHQVRFPLSLVFHSLHFSLSSSKTYTDQRAHCSYWSFGNRTYNYVEAATAAGYATLSYDRLGVGKSDKPSPYNEIQTPIQLATLAQLTDLLRTGKIRRGIPVPEKVVHVGHSYGSLYSNALVAAKPELSDALVLAGFSRNGSWATILPIASGFTIANQENGERFGGYDNGFLTRGGRQYNQLSFLTYPNFDEAVLDKSEREKQNTFYSSYTLHDNCDSVNALSVCPSGIGAAVGPSSLPSGHAQSGTASLLGIRIFSFFATAFHLSQQLHADHLRESKSI
jgi:pimeloyl-ACP methyl ester carboxylesterase